MNDIVLVVAVGAVIGVIVWAFYKLFRKTDTEMGAIDGGDVALLATGMQDPSLAVAAYAAGEAGEDEVDTDLTPVIAATTVISAVNEDSTPTVSEPSTTITEKVWEHHETPVSEPVSHVSESIWSHSESSSSSYDSGSSSCGGGDCGSCGGGD